LPDGPGLGDKSPFGQPQKNLESDTLLAETVIGRSKVSLSINDFTGTISLLREAQRRTRRATLKSLHTILTLYLASLEHLRGNIGAAKKYFTAGRALARVQSDPLVVRNLLSGSVIHYSYCGRFQEAIQCLESIEPMLFNKLQFRRLSLIMGIVLGVTYGLVGRLSQGLGLLNQLRETALALPDQASAAHASVNMGILLFMKKDLDGALRTISESLQLSPKPDLYTQFYGSLYLACIYLKKNDISESQKHLAFALQIWEKNPFTLTGQLLEFGLATEQGRFPATHRLSLEKEIHTALLSENVYVRGLGWRYKAKLQEIRKESQESILQSLKKSLACLKSSGCGIELAETMQALGRFYLQRGRARRAKRTIEEAASLLRQYGAGDVADDLKPQLQPSWTRDDLLDTILTAGSEVVALNDIREVTRRILTGAMKITGGERGGIFIKSADSSQPGFEILAAKNLTLEDTLKPAFHRSKEMIAKSAKTGLGLVDNPEGAATGESDDKDPLKSRIFVPLLLRGETIGVLYQDNRIIRTTFKEQDLKVLSYFASLAAIALDNAFAYKEIRRLNQRLNEEKQYLEEQQQGGLHLEDFVAASPAIKKVLALVEQVASTESTVCISGETGVGKEMVARAVHQYSRRSDKPFIRVNCSALPETLIHSELFGHEKGAFTGADKRRLGRFELADGGTLFLDEIGEMSLDLQVRLLRVLQTREFERVGGSESIRSDFRLVAATNRDLSKAVVEGRFREDLYYRLNVFPIPVPPLRQRPEDIAPLALHFLKKHSEKSGKNFTGIPAPDMQQLQAYHWPGNVRELENVIERGVILNREGVFRVPEFHPGEREDGRPGAATLEDMERRFIAETLQKTNWKIYGPGGAAQLLGLNHSTLYSRMKKLNIKKRPKS